MEAALPARKALRLSQKDFARLIGATPATVRNWEQGRTPIPPMARKFIRVVERHPEVLADLAETA
jgi:putative transcriptional regulator